MIEMDESEHMHSDFTDFSLNWIRTMYGHEVKDLFLIPRGLFVEVKSAWTSLDLLETS